MMNNKLKEFLLSKSNARLNFDCLIEFIEGRGIIFREEKLIKVLGMATPYGIYVNINMLNRLDSSKVFFIMLHEVCHYLRIQIMGVEKMLEALSFDDFEDTTNHIIDEELFADRYASLLYYKFNNRLYPRYGTQQLDKKSNRTTYKKYLSFLEGRIQNNEEKYKKMINEFIE